MLYPLSYRGDVQRLTLLPVVSRPASAAASLDMAFLLPAAIFSSVLLFRRRALGFLLAPVLLTAMILIAVGIVAAMIVLGSRGEAAPIGVTVAIGAMTVLQLGFLVRFLHAAAADDSATQFGRPTALEGESALVSSPSPPGDAGPTKVCPLGSRFCSPA